MRENYYGLSELQIIIAFALNFAWLTELLGVTQCVNCVSLLE